MMRALMALSLTLIVLPALGQSTSVPGKLVEPVFNPADFAPITHKYFTLRPGTKFTYAKKTDKGMKRVEIEVTGETRRVMGVMATVVRDREWLNGVLEEDTRDWYAQDKAGNVWYLGEAVDNFRDGKLADHAGSWESAVGGGKPGIIMLKEPKAGDTYRQEFLPGKAEDMGTVVAVGTKVSVPHGTFEDCVQIKDWSRIESDEEYKYFCSEVGFMVLEEEGSERLELTGVAPGDLPTMNDDGAARANGHGVPRR
jgi:hypothetical protein